MIFLTKSCFAHDLAPDFMPSRSKCFPDHFIPIQINALMMNNLHQYTHLGVRFRLDRKPAFACSAAFAGGYHLPAGAVGRRSSDMLYRLPPAGRRTFVFYHSFSCYSFRESMYYRFLFGRRPIKPGQVCIKKRLSRAFR